MERSSEIPAWWNQNWDFPHFTSTSVVATGTVASFCRGQLVRAAKLKRKRVVKRES